MASRSSRKRGNSEVDNFMTRLTCILPSTSETIIETQHAGMFVLFKFVS